MQLVVKCAYCPTMITLSFGKNDRIEINGRDSLLGPVITCHKCDSKFVLEVKTLRKSRGKRQKQHEIETKEAHEREVEAKRAANKLAGDKLLAEPGCTCRERIEGRNSSYYSSMTSNGKDSGHPLSTGWSRAPSGAMLPTDPHHFTTCPLWHKREVA